MAINRNKRSIVLNLKDADDIAFARRLALTGDIVLDNFKPGFMAQLGLDRASLAADKPDIITATVTAFGGDTEAAHLPGYDLAVQGMSGIMHLTGEVGGRASASAYPSSTCLPATTRPSACSLHSTNEGRPVSVATSRSR